MRVRSCLEDFSNEDIKQLFVQELDWQLQRHELRRFKRWVAQKVYPNDREAWPYNYFLWLIERIHEYRGEGKAVVE